VWLDGRNLKTNRPTKKLDSKCFGLFKITEIVHKGAYKLQLPPTWKIHPVFNESLLSPFTLPLFSSQSSDDRPLPELVEGEEYYEVEEILEARRPRRGGLQFLVKWKGYPTEENTWEPERNLAKSPEALAEFYSKYPDAPRRLHRALSVVSAKYIRSAGHGDMTLTGGICQAYPYPTPSPTLIPDSPPTPVVTPTNRRLSNCSTIRQLYPPTSSRNSDTPILDMALESDFDFQIRMLGQCVGSR
jgi:Chromo (CHRromatin Organisation MOdifier) domain